MSDKFEKYSDIEIGMYASIPLGTSFWSIALQEQIINTRDLVIKVTGKCVPDNDYVFGTIQTEFKNIILAALIGEKEAMGYNDRAHGEIGISYKKIRKI